MFIILAGAQIGKLEGKEGRKVSFLCEAEAVGICFSGGVMAVEFVLSPELRQGPRARTTSCLSAQAKLNQSSLYRKTAELEKDGGVCWVVWFVGRG